MPNTLPTLGDFLRLLDAATEKGKLTWKQTADESTFRAVLDNGFIQIGKNSSPPPYRLELVAENGLLIEEYQPSTEGERLAAEALYKKARNAAMHLEDKVFQFFTELKTRAGQP
jgi:hypothetical protein